MIFAGFLSSIVVACPGCSFQGTSLRLQYPGDVFWAWMIIAFVIAAIPLLMLCGMRVSRRRPRPSRKRTAILTAVFVLIYMLSFSTTFSGFVLSWLFLPLNIIQMMLMGISWSGGFIAILLLPLTIGVIPFYMYCMVKFMRRFDRKLYWKSGRTWQRLKMRERGLEPRQKDSAE